MDWVCDGPHTFQNNLELQYKYKCLGLLQYPPFPVKALLDIDRGCVDPNLQCGRRLMWEWGKGGRKDLRRKTALLSPEENEIIRKEAGGSGEGRKKNQAPILTLCQLGLG